MSKCNLFKKEENVFGVGVLLTINLLQRNTCCSDSRKLIWRANEYFLLILIIILSVNYTLFKRNIPPVHFYDEIEQNTWLSPPPPSEEDNFQKKFWKWSWKQHLFLFVVTDIWNRVSSCIIQVKSKFIIICLIYDSLLCFVVLYAMGRPCCRLPTIQRTKVTICHNQKFVSWRTPWRINKW